MGLNSTPGKSCITTLVRVVNPKKVDAAAVLAVLECANCSLHATVDGGSGYTK